jgi:hypothetical protein
MMKSECSHPKEGLAFPGAQGLLEDWAEGIA